MSGYALGQAYSFGATEQTTVQPGAGGAAAAPAAGASYTYTLTRFDRWRLVFVTFALTTDATAGNRYVTLEYAGGDGVSFTADAAAVEVTPSTTAQRFVGQYRRGPGEWNTGTDVFFPLCGIWLEAGRTIKVNVASIGAADQLSNIRLTFDRTIPPAWFDGADVETP